MLSLRTHVKILVAFFVALVVIGWGGAILGGMGLIHPSPALQIPMLIVMGLLVLGLVFSAVPVMVMLVMGSEHPRRKTVIYVFWSLIALGSLIAIPAAILGGAFNS